MRPLPRPNRGRRINSPVYGMLLAAVWLAVGGGGAAAIGQPERAARAGMAAYRGGDFEAAAGAFTGAAELRPGNAGLLYNAGAAAYRLGSYGVARRLLQASISGAADDRLAAAGHLAMGHSWTEEAEQLAETDPAAAMAALEAAITSYERTLRLNGDRDEAAYHLERARAMLDELRRQMAQDSTDSQDGGEQRQQQQDQQGQQQTPQQQDQQGTESGQQPDQQQQELQEQQAPPQDAAQQDAGTQQETAAQPRSDDAADAVARQIIAAEEALAAMMERRRQEMEPVAREW